jgi:hypothetical protein
MTISLRLNERLAKQLESVAREKGVSKSQLVRQCLEEYLSQQRERPTPWELGKHLFGRHGGGRRDLAENSEKIVNELIHAKASRR